MPMALVAALPALALAATAAAAPPLPAPARLLAEWLPTPVLSSTSPPTSAAFFTTRCNGEPR